MRQPILVDSRAIHRRAPHPSPPASSVVLLRLTPEMFSVIDCSKGSGHSDLVTFSGCDLDIHLSTFEHRWDDEHSSV